MVIELRVAGVVVTVVDPDTPANVAVMVALPIPLPVTRPLVPLALLTATRDGEEETQFTKAVRSWVVPSEKFPVAKSCLLVPWAIRELGGVMVIEVRVAEVTVTVVDPDTPATIATMVAVPAPLPATRPLIPPVLPTAAICGAEETHCTVAVRSWIVLSTKTPVAVSCRLVLLAMVGFTGVTVSDFTIGSGKPPWPPPPPHPARFKTSTLSPASSMITPRVSRFVGTISSELPYRFKIAGSRLP